MKKYALSIFMATIVPFLAAAQPKVGSGNGQLSVSASFPIGRFADSHSFGGGLTYKWSHGRFGSASSKKLIGFTAMGGFDYFFGQKEAMAGYSFKKSNALYVQVMPGIICNPLPRSSVSLTAGPSLGIFRDASSMALGVNLSGVYKLGRSIGIGPSVFYRKHADVAAYWTAGIKAGYAF